MQKRFNVAIYNKSGQKVNGMYIPGEPTYVKNIDCDIQPYSTELFQKQYGYEIEVNAIIFADPDMDIKIGTILKYTNKFGIIESYEVKKIIPWNSFWEVFVLGI